MTQQRFDFVAEMDRDLAEQRERDREEMKRRNEDAILHSMVEHHPPVNEEWDVILMGIRLARHVHHSECERCKLDTYSHCPPSLGMHWIDDYGGQYTYTKVCLKDYIRWCARHGLKDLAKEALEY